MSASMMRAGPMALADCKGSAASQTRAKTSVSSRRQFLGTTGPTSPVTKGPFQILRKRAAAASRRSAQLVRASVRTEEEAEANTRPGIATVPRNPPSALSGQPGTQAYGAPSCGAAEPLGPSTTEDGSINLALYASGATSATLCLFSEGDLAGGRSTFEIALDPNDNRTGDIWHIRLPIKDRSLLYGYRLDGPHQDKIPSAPQPAQTPPAAAGMEPGSIMGSGGGVPDGMTHAPVDPEHDPGMMESGEVLHGHRYNVNNVVLDPYAYMVLGRRNYGELGMDLDYENPAVLGLASTWTQQACAFPPERDNFDWEGDRPLGRPMEDLVIYEMHVRGFTAGGDSGASSPGTFEAVTQKMDYLESLGITAIELLPIQDFNELEYYQVETGASPRYNFWGYSTCSFFAPMSRYSAAAARGAPAPEISSELKTFVKEAHRRGMEVILDVVFNHTAEGNEMGPSISFRGLDNRVYYMLAPQGEYYNYSGCGNTLNCNHPVVRRFIVDCLRFWVTEYHIDGFRFDLASILTRAHSAWQQGTELSPEGVKRPPLAGDGGKGDPMTINDGVMSNGAGVVTGTPLGEPPLIEEISQDPILMNIKLIAEAWDCDGLNQVGAFPHYNGRWAEWNGNFRDTARQFIKGTDGPWAGAFAEILCGSPGTYGSHDATSWWGQNGGQQWVGGRLPIHSVNFITAHDGFTLADLVSYNDKHNAANGEDNNDGEEHNLSWNCGVEGPTDDGVVLRMRQRQMRNFMGALLLAQGVPMILMGDEYGHTKNGNNNTYCHDDPLNWHDWNAANKDESGLRRFVSSLIKFRRKRPELGLMYFPDGQNIKWHGVNPDEPDWSDSSRLLALTLTKKGDHNWQRPGLYVAWNTSHTPVTVTLPEWEGSDWRLVADSSKPAPYDFLVADDVLSAAEVVAARDSTKMWTKEFMYPMLPRSMIILEAVPSHQNISSSLSEDSMDNDEDGCAELECSAMSQPSSHAPPHQEPTWTPHPQGHGNPQAGTAEAAAAAEENRKLRQKAIDMGLIPPGSQ